MAKADVVAALVEIRRAEFTAAIQYSANAAELRNQGIEKLASEMEGEAAEELSHAAVLADRIFFLRGELDNTPLGEVKSDSDLAGILRISLDMERAAVARYNDAIGLCLAEGDSGTRLVLEGILAGEEAHVAKYDLMLSQIEKLGRDTFLMCVCGSGVPLAGSAPGPAS
jgi:bacterioferritin